MKKLITVFLMIALFATMTVGCTSSKNTGPSKDNSDAASSTSQEKSTASDIDVAVVLHALNGNFYTKLKEGAEAAGRDLGINVNVSAPNSASSLQEQVGLMETAIASGADAIATVTWDATGFNAVIAEAESKGIPVVSFNMRADSCGAKCFVGQDYEPAAFELGKYVFEAMGGEGTYIIASCGPTDTALIAREAGIDAAAETYGGQIKKLETINIGTDLNNAYSVIENALLAHPDVTAIIGVDVFSEAIGSVLEDYDKSGVVYAGGFDLTEGMLQHIKNGSVQVTCGQNPFMQGYYAVQSCYMNLVHHCDFIDINTGAQLVDINNVDSVEPE